MRTALVAMALLAACGGGDGDCPRTLPIRSETGEVRLLRGVGVIRADGTPDGCRSWAGGDELHEFRYRQQWGVSPLKGDQSDETGF